MTHRPGYIVVPVLGVPKDPWIQPVSFPQPPDTVHERITDRGAAVAVKLVITSGGQVGAGRETGGGNAGDGDGAIGEATSVGDGDGMRTGVGLSEGVSVGLGLASA
jgi:hypothetical protein